MTEFKSVDAAAVIDIFLLLLIGVGPKIALVPFLDLTADMPAATKARVVRDCSPSCRPAGGPPPLGDAPSAAQPDPS